MKSFFIAILLLVGFVKGFAQTPLDTRLQNQPLGKPLITLLTEIENSQTVRFYYLDEWLEKIVLTTDFNGKTLRYALESIFNASEIQFIEIDPKTIVFVMDPTKELARYTFLAEANQARKNIDKIVVGDPEKPSNKDMVTLRGKITEEKSEEPLLGANILVQNLFTGAVTNLNGEYMISLPKGSHILTINYVNYEEKVIDLDIWNDGVLSWNLQEKPRLLEEVVIEDQSSKEVTTSAIGLVQLSMKNIKMAPSFLGVADIIKQIQNLPGVSTVGEAASGFNVRGGSVDQNLILYDGMPVFNSSHVFGFFSSFNADAVRDASFYRGGIPARYGGRISSVLDIRSKEGDPDHWNFNAGIGLLSTQAAADGPLKKNKSLLAASFRTTYSDWLLSVFNSNYVDLRDAGAAFSDGSIKFSQIFSPKSKLVVSGYISNDRFNLQPDSTFKWNTYLATGRYDLQLNDELSLALSAGWGKYKYNVIHPVDITGFDLSYELTYPSGKAELFFKRGRHEAELGIQTTYYDFRPGTLTPNSPVSNKREIIMPTQFSWESGFFLADSYRVNEQISIDGGLRLSQFTRIGSGTVYLYEPGTTRISLNVVDSLVYAKGEKIKSYFNVEPRLGARWQISPSASIKVSYNRTVQNLHLISNTAAVTPVDVWQPGGYYLKPQKADQFSAGYFFNFKDNVYDAFVEAYYKNIENVVDFRDGAVLLLNDKIEGELLQGQARTYGIEMQVNKKEGNFTGSLSYTFSRSFRTIDGELAGESINNGKEFRANFDQPHNLNFNWRHKLTRRYYFTGNFSYNTGRPVTVPITAFSYENLNVTSFSARNAYRIPDYHRLDLGLMLEGNHKRDKLFHGNWVLSVYNVYARKNPYTVYFEELDKGVLRPFQLAIIGTAVPSISYNMKF